MTFAQTGAADPVTSVWVSASAGTGKTKVLVDRLIRILYQGTPISHIVCLTFTKAAALEMRERLLARLQYDSLSHDIAATLYESLLESPESLKVMTLHGYCQGLLQKFPFEAGVLPFFDVLDDDQAYQLLMRALNNVLESPPTEAIADAIEGVSQWMGEYVFERCLLDAFSKWHKVRHLERAYPDPTDYRVALERAFPADFSESTVPFIDIIEMARLLCASSQAMDQTLGAALLVNEPVGGAVGGLAPHLFLTHLFLPKDGSLRKRIVSADFKKKNPYISSALEAFADYIYTVQLRQNYVGWLDANMHFWQIVQSVLAVFQTLKTEQGLLDYHDLILHSLALFSDDLSLSFVHQRLDYTIDHILVDEAQDNSPEQWLFILKLVDLFIRDDTPHRSLFVVGDMKQSIYGFQGAVPHLFETLAGTFESILTNRGHAFITLTLDDSFRTTPEVLRVVDTIFATDQLTGQLTGKCAGMGTYTNHKPYRTDQGWVGTALRSKDDIKRIVCDNEDDIKEALEWAVFDRYETELSKDQILANDVADHVERVLTEGWVLPSLSQKYAPNVEQLRAIEPRDILILQRNRGALAADIIRALKQRNIAVEGPDRIHLATRQCIQDVMAVMRFLCLPEDDMALAHILKSPFANDGHGFDEAVLFSVCHGRSESLWRVLCEQEAGATIDQAFDLSASDSVHLALTNLTQSLKAWLSLVDYERPSFLLKSIIAPALSAFENRLGADIHLLFDTFLDTVMDLEIKASTLSEVLFQLEQSMPVIKRDPTTPTGVRLMTVHGSKGLEAPFVILVDRDERLDLSKENLLWAKIDDVSTGEVIDIFCLKPKANMAIEAMYLLRDNTLAAKQEENNRLFYVALTRSRDALLVIGGGEWTKAVHQVLRDVDAESVPPFSHEILHGSQLHQCEQMEALLPLWIDERYGAEVKPVDSSIPLESQTKAMQRGVATHALIEMLIKTPKERWDILFEKAKDSELTEIDIRNIYEMATSSDFSFLFGQSVCNAWAEMEVMHDRKLYRIDMVVEVEDAFWIIDFKTGKPCVTLGYVQQLTLYSHLVNQMIPHCDDKKGIRAFLLWTDALVLEEINL